MMSSRPQNDGKAKLVLALLMLAGAALLIIPFFLTPPATLEVLLRDEVFDSDLDGRSARVTYAGDGAGLPIPIRRNTSGFLARVGRIPSGEGTLELHVPGFETASLSVQAKPLETVRAAVPLLPSFGRIEVSVVDAREADRPVPAAQVTVNRAAVPNRGAVAIADLSPGNHEVQAEARGYCAAKRSASVRQRETTQVKVPLSPAVGGDQVARAVLDWRENPRDLDAHLNLAETPVALAAPHVYYVNQRGVTAQGDIFAELDVDYVNSEGYETVTLYDQAPGVYQYFVHLYAGEGTLGGSGATVEIFTREGNGCESRRFTVPTGCNERWWYVADLRVSSAGVAIGEKNECLATPASTWRGRAK